MYRFTNDYSEACHPAILSAIAQSNLEGNFGYSTDSHCENAKALVKQAIHRTDADVHFLVGGTQVNATAICAFLRPHQAVIATRLGHICCHETGAIEATGHKCIAVPCEQEGKLSPSEIRKAVLAHPDEHTVQPKMVYISNTTEMGAVYTYEELKALRCVCDELGLYLYLDGARLASALASGGATLEQTAQLCDAFTIGGTKNGALFGEALCILNPQLKPDFRYVIKQHGGLLAKGFLLGIQYEVLMKDGLYEALGLHATKLALQLRDGMKKLGVPFLCDSPSNQQFPILPNKVLSKLKSQFHWEVTSIVDEESTCIRLVTSWATQQEAVDSWLSALAKELK